MSEAAFPMGLRRSARLAAVASLEEEAQGRGGKRKKSGNANALKAGEDSKLVLKKKSRNPKGKETQIILERKTKTKSLKRFPSRDLEIELWRSGFVRVIGVDEAGRGPLAGPVVAAACIIPPDIIIQGVDDSKKLTAEKRSELYSQIVSSPGVLFSVCVVDAQRIDEINILQATMQAMAECVEKLTNYDGGSAQYILVDGNRIPDRLPAHNTKCVVKGDSECHIIAAASILAKVTRDKLMEDYDRKWPVYGFKDHKGYGTASHTAALLKYGPCDIHRRSFAPLKNHLKVQVQ